MQLRKKRKNRWGEVMTQVQENTELMPWLEQAMSEFYQHGLVVIKNAIPTELCQALLREVSSSAALQPAGVGRQNQLQLNNDIRRDYTQWLDGSSHAQQQYLQRLDLLQQQINRRCFLGLTHYECHFARYQQGDFYQKHLDAFKGRSNRVLTTVCYLNSVQVGGELAIYDEHDQLLQQIQPTQGTLIMFESERFPHEVKAAGDLRFSIAGWFRKD